MSANQIAIEASKTQVLPLPLATVPGIRVTENGVAGPEVPVITSSVSASSDTIVVIGPNNRFEPSEQRVQ